MNVAKAKITSAQEAGKEFRKVFPDVYRLGYMSKPVGLVFDPVNGDTILIGEKGNVSNLFLDDFVCALNPRYRDGEYHWLTIDPDENNPDAKWHHVTMTEGIKNTNFGKVLFESDYLLKKISLNLVKTNISKFKTQYHLMAEEKKKNSFIYSRFWFHPSAVEILASKNALLIYKYPIKVSSDALYAPCVRFAQSFTSRFDEFAKKMPIFEDLRNMERWAGIASSISAMNYSPDLDFWRKEYKVKVEEDWTPEKVKALSNFYGDLNSFLKCAGGVDTAILNLRLKAKDSTALSDLANLVINTRPSEDALFWGFTLQEYKFSFAAQSGVDISEIEKLIAKGVASALKKEPNETIENFSEVIKLAPDFAHAYLFRATAYTAQGDYDKAISDCQKVIEIEGRSIISSLAHFISGMSYQKKGLNEEALFNYSKTLEINPGFIFAWFKREDLLGKEELLSDLKKREINIRENQNLKSPETEEPTPILWDPESKTIWVNLAEFLDPKYGGGEVSVGDVLSDKANPFRIIGFSLATNRLPLPRSIQIPQTLSQTLNAYRIGQASYGQGRYNFYVAPPTLPHQSVNVPRYNYQAPVTYRPVSGWNPGSGASSTKFPSQNTIPSTTKYPKTNSFPSISDDR